MTVKELLKKANLKAVSLPKPGREINGVHVGDLLSHVMSKARKNQAWITVISNVNVIAVASLTEVSCIILADGVALDPKTRAVAEEKGINVLSSDLPIFETSVLLFDLLK